MSTKGPTSRQTLRVATRSGLRSIVLKAFFQVGQTKPPAKTHPPWSDKTVVFFGSGQSSRESVLFSAVHLRATLRRTAAAPQPIGVSSVHRRGDACSLQGGQRRGVASHPCAIFGLPCSGLGRSGLIADIAWVGKWRRLFTR